MAAAQKEKRQQEEKSRVLELQLNSLETEKMERVKELQSLKFSMQEKDKTGLETSSQVKVN